MPDQKKRSLVELLTRHRIPLIEDDIYGNLSFDDSRPNVAKAYDREGWVLLCDSFTKSLSAGYRVGWIAPGRFKERVQFLKFVNTSATASLPQMAIAEFLQNGGYDHHLRKIRRFYAAQVQRMTEAVTRYFPEGTRVTRPTGGMCLWLELPQRIDSLKLFQRAMAAKISIAPGPLFSSQLWQPMVGQTGGRAQVVGRSDEGLRRGRVDWGDRWNVALPIYWGKDRTALLPR